MCDDVDTESFAGLVPDLLSREGGGWGVAIQWGQLPVWGLVKS